MNKENNVYSINVIIVAFHAVVVLVLLVLAFTGRIDIFETQERYTYHWECIEYSEEKVIISCINYEDNYNFYLATNKNNLPMEMNEENRCKYDLCHKGTCTIGLKSTREIGYEFTKVEGYELKEFKTVSPICLKEMYVRKIIINDDGNILSEGY